MEMLHHKSVPCQVQTQRTWRRSCRLLNPGAIKPSLLVEHLHSQCCLPEPNAYKYWLSGRILTKAGSSSRILTNASWLSGQNPDKYWLPGQNPDKHWLPEMALWVEYALESEFRCRLILQAESWLSKSKTCQTLFSKKSIRLSNPSNPWVS